MYCNSLTQYQRFKTRAIKVGNIGIGGNNPIRILSAGEFPNVPSIHGTSVTCVLQNNGMESISKKF